MVEVVVISVVVTVVFTRAILACDAITTCRDIAAVTYAACEQL